MVVDVPSASAIEPRMSVCLKGTTKFLEGLDLSEEFDLSDSEHEDSLVFTKLDVCDDENREMIAFRRSPLSASSVLMTGTTYPILRTSQVDEAAIKRRQEKANVQSNGIRFSESVHVRNHIHAKDISDNEKLAAWFRKPEYKTIFKNNTQIISIIEKRERELKRTLAKKQRENKKKKCIKNIGLNMSITKSAETTGAEVVETSCAEVMVGEDDLQEQNFGIDEIIGVHRDDERGFSIRGLENETAKKRRIRDQTYLKAKLAVLSVQEDIDEHMFSLQEQHEEKLATISRGKKKNKRRFSLNRQMVPEDQEEDSEKIQQMIDVAKEEFAVYAKAQYKNMIRTIAEKYEQICMKDAKDALERGIQDEKTVRAIDWIESEGDNSHGSILSSAKGMSDSSQDQEKRRPSTTSTAPTEISAVSSLISSEGMRLSRVKRAKMFLSKFV
mmetsp:Transcript_9756/g.24296  ORF Transcript_9756/g.24296 Transcript_9756/m.24296 type:complete len:442 (-) Transcript_9756:132-1457(-)